MPAPHIPNDTPAQRLYHAGIRVSNLEKRVRELEDGIRKHEGYYYTGDVNDLCFENDFELYLLLPEHRGKTVEDFVKPEGLSEERWLQNCGRYYCSRWGKQMNMD